MIYHNRGGDDFSPPSQLGFDRGLICDPPDALTQEQGLYYRNRIFPGLKALVDKCVEGEMPFSELPIDAYQSWVESGWKAPHGSYHAAKRLKAKGIEETRELDGALREYWETDSEQHLIEEAGDNLWVHTARSSNAGNVASDSIKTRLYEYIAGTKMYIKDQPMEPDWYDAAAKVAIKKGSPTIGEIDTVIGEGFVGRASPVMNLYDTEEFSANEAMLDLHVFTTGASNINMWQHDPGDGTGYVSVRSYENQGNDVGVFTSEAYFRIASLAHFAGRTLADVVAVNMQKIDQRIREGLVDKSDGARDIGQ